MKRFLFLSAVLSVSAIASTIGTCVPGALKSYVGNPCSLGDQVFESFDDTGGADASRINMAATEFRLILAPFTGAGFFTNLATFARGVSGQLVVENSPSSAYTPVPETETGDPVFFASTSSIVTTPTLTGPAGTGAASLGTSSFEQQSIQADAVVPEPAPLVLIGTGLLCLGLLRKRAA